LESGLERSNRRLKVAFVCVHNSYRSQVAEALAGWFAGAWFDGYSAGTELKPEINPDAVRLVREMYGIDMASSQRPKLVTELPRIDVVVKMGCEVACPYLPSRYEEDWGLTDPTGRGDDEQRAVIAEIERLVRDLAQRIAAGALLPERSPNL